MPYSKHYMKNSIPKNNKGIVLPLALFLLIVISIIGVMTIGNSTQNEKNIQSLRINAAAQQGAEIALRYCEDLTMQFVADPSSTRYTSAEYGKISTTSIAKPDATGALWLIAANWKSGGSNLISIPTSTYAASVTGALKNAPSCIIQKLGTESYLITARGLGNDAIVDSSTGKVKTGGEIWLQSTLTPES